MADSFSLLSPPLSHPEEMKKPVSFHLFLSSTPPPLYHFTHLNSFISHLLLLPLRFSLLSKNCTTIIHFFSLSLSLTHTHTHTHTHTQTNTHTHIHTHKHCYERGSVR